MYYQGKRRGEDGIGAIIDFLLANARLVIGVGGACVLGIATLAVKRLIERAGRPAGDDEKPDKKLTDSWEELGLVGSSPKLLKKGLEGVVMKRIAAATKKADLSQPSVPEQPRSHPDTDPMTPVTPVTPQRKRLDLCVLTFQDRLQQYYRTRVCLPPEEVSRQQQRALDVAMEIQHFLHSKHPDMPLGEMTLAGSLLDDLQVVRADHACLLVPLQLEGSLWGAIRGEETFLGHAQFCMLRRENLEYFPRGRSYWDRHIVGSYLSSRLVAEQLRRSVTEAMNWPSLAGTLECEVRPVLGSDEIRLEVRPDDGNGNRRLDDDEVLYVSVVPTVRLGGFTLTAQPEVTAAFDYVWYQSLYPAETAELAARDLRQGHGESQEVKVTAGPGGKAALSSLGHGQGESQGQEAKVAGGLAGKAAHGQGCGAGVKVAAGVRRKVLKTLKAVCRNCPALRRLAGGHLGSVVLHLSDREADWSEVALAERFQQAVADLIGYLEAGFLPAYFKPAVNLLQGFTEDEIDEMGFMLYCAVSEPEILLL